MVIETAQFQTAKMLFRVGLDLTVNTGNPVNVRSSRNFTRLVDWHNKRSNACGRLSQVVGCQVGVPLGGCITGMT